MATATSTFSLNVSAIKALCQGASGNTILNGFGAPTVTNGVSGDFYIDIASLTAYNFYGPKTTTWPATAVMLTTSNYVTAYVNSIASSLTGGGSVLATNYLQYAGIPGYGGLSALNIGNNGNYPHIKAYGSGALNFQVTNTGAISGNSLTLVNGISANVSNNLVTTSYLYGNLVTGDASNLASLGSLANGLFNTATGSYTHAEGYTTQALGAYSHSEGNNTFATGSGAHTEGFNSYGLGNYTHVEGTSGVGYHDYTHVWAASAPGMGAAVGVCTSDKYQDVNYGNGIFLGNKVGINTFALSSVTVLGVASTLLVPPTSLPATLSINGTVSANNTIYAGLSAPIAVASIDTSPLVIGGSATGSVYNTVVNTFAGVSASTDISLYNNDVTNCVDLGITSTSYNGNIYAPKFNIVKAGDSYLYSTSGNMVVGAANAVFGDLVFFTGGTLSGSSVTSGNERMRIINSTAASNAGYVGFNTSTPNQQVTIYGGMSALSSFSTNYYDAVSNRILTNRQTPGFANLTAGTSTSANIITQVNLIISALTAHGLAI